MLGRGGCAALTVSLPGGGSILASACMLEAPGLLCGGSRGEPKITHSIAAETTPEQTSKPPRSTMLMRQSRRPMPDRDGLGSGAGGCGGCRCWSVIVSGSVGVSDMATSVNLRAGNAPWPRAVPPRKATMGCLAWRPQRLISRKPPRAEDQNFSLPPERRHPNPAMQRQPMLRPTLRLGSAARCRYDALSGEKSLRGDAPCPTAS